MAFNAAKLIQLRKDRGWTQDDVVEKTDIKMGTYRDIEQGKSKDPSLETVRKLAELFGIAVDEFINGGYVPKQIGRPRLVAPPQQPATTITFQINPVDIPELPPVPILGAVGAGPALDDPSYEVLDFAKLFAGDLAAYTVIGDSMREAHILSGDTIIIRKTPSPAPGEDVVAWIDAHKGCVIKTFRGGRSTLGWLASDDGWRHDLTEADTVYGALVSIIRSKRPAIVQKPKKKPKKGE